MVDEHAKFHSKDLKGQNDLELEVNWSEDVRFEGCVKLKLGGKEAIVPLKDLYSFVFFAGNEEQQDNLMPVKQTTVKKLVKWHTVKAVKTIPKGELLKVRCETNVETAVVEGLKGLMGKKSFAISNSIPIIKAKGST